MKIIAPLLLTLTLLTGYRAVAQTSATDTAKYKVEYAILKTNTYEVAYSHGIWQNLYQTLALKADNSEAIAFENVFKCFEYLNKRGYEMVSGYKDRYTFIKKIKQ